MRVDCHEKVLGYLAEQWSSDGICFSDGSKFAGRVVTSLARASQSLGAVCGLKMVNLAAAAMQPRRAALQRLRL